MAAVDVPLGTALQRRGQSNLGERVFEIATLASLVIALGFLILLIVQILQGALPLLGDRGIGFVTDKLSPRVARTGLNQAIIGSLQIALITVVVAFPLGIATAIFLEEYASDTWFTRIVDVNIRNLAGVPSIVFGLLGFAIFVRLLEPVTGGSTALAGGLTLALLALPIVVITSAEAIRAVPLSLREGGFGLGGTRWQITRKLVLPNALPGILTGTILALARAIGETAPLLVIGAATFLTIDASLLGGLTDRFTALPVIVFHWSKQPSREFVDAAAPAAILVLMLFTLTLNAVAIWLRNRYEKRKA
jgi:phosphate transport system permease protein